MKMFKSLLVFGFVILSACAEKTVPELLVINLLDKELYDDCHIKGSVSVPFENFENYIEGLSKDQKIVVYCTNYMCGSSASAYQMLKDSGFENIWAYEAGMAEWFQNELPVEGPSKEEYLKFIVSGDGESVVGVITSEDLYELIKKYNLV